MIIDIILFFVIYVVRLYEIPLVRACAVNSFVSCNSSGHVAILTRKIDVFSVFMIIVKAWFSGQSMLLSFVSKQKLHLG